MKKKFILGLLLLGSAVSAWAFGYTDGVEYYKAGQYGNAKTILENSLTEPGTDLPAVYYYLGQIELLYKNNDKAKEYFEKGLAIDPENPYNYVGLGNLALRQGDEKTAEKYFKDAMKKDKKNAEIPVDIARAYYYYGPENPKCIKKMEEYIEKARKVSKNQEPAIYVLIGDRYFDMGGHLNEAAQEWEQAIYFDPNNPEAYVKYANAYRGVNPEYSIKKYQELLEKCPTSSLAQRELAEIYYENGRWTDAADLYGNYIKNPNHFPEDEARYCFLLFANGEKAKSLDIANQILASNPKDAQAQRIKMLVLADLGEYQDAKNVAENFFKEDNIAFTQTDYITYGNILLGLQDYDNSYIQYQKAIDMNPTSPSNWASLATAYYMADKNEDAALTLEKAMTLMEEPTLTDHLRVSGYWLYAAIDAEDPAVKKDYAERGIKNIDVVIDRVATVAPDYIRRKGQLQYTRNNNQVNEEVFNTFSQLVAMLDEDPANMTAGNSHLTWYRQAYQLINDWYRQQGDTEKQQETMAKFEAVQNLIGQ